MNMKDLGSTLLFAINDTQEGHNVPSLSLGETSEGLTLWAKAVFADEASANEMKAFMNIQSECPGRFEVVVVELWRPTDIEKYVRERIRESEKEKGPKIQLLT
ncbi:hypothetical protein [Salmonella phage SSBI34]|nr:hypothetical protein [Salmonella phage SSBI34]